MFCPNCGKKRGEDESFCSNCGFQFEETTVEKLEKTKQTMQKKGKEILMKHHKKLIFSFSVFGIFFFFLGFLLNSSIFVAFHWDKKYPIISQKNITQTKAKLGIVLGREKDINEVKYKTTCGTIQKEKNEIIWALRKSTGKCKIEASYKLKKIKKEFQILPFVEKENLVLDEFEEEKEDMDLDGLTKDQEKEYKTNPNLSDSDMDNLNDFYEIFTSKTDPNKKDSDNDGLSDYDEITLGLDPLQKDSKKDNQKDGDRTLTYTIKKDDFTVVIEGIGNIASTFAEINTNTNISKKEGLLDKLFVLSTDAKIKQATIEIPYTQEELEEKNLKEENLSIYYYKEENGKYEKVDTTIDKERNLLTANLTHFSNYVVGDSSLVKENATTEILFLLDNSWSLYTNEQYEKITGEKYREGLLGLEAKLDGYDPEGIRFSVTKDLIKRLEQKNYKMGLSEFRQDYKNALPIGSSTSAITKQLGNMNGKFITKSAGTDIENALINGIREFDDESDNKYLVILTDGRDTVSNYGPQEVIENATAKNVKICSVGLGDATYNTKLSNISNATGCALYTAGNASGLAELFDNMGALVGDSFIDVDNDNKEDGLLLLDSGFLVTRDGFSFPNYTSNLTGGHCYGMATFAQLYFKKMLPLSLAQKTVEENTSYAYNLSSSDLRKNINLYDYKLQSNALKYSFGYELFQEEMPADFRGLEDDILTIQSKYKNEIEKTNLYDIVTTKTSLSEKEQKKKWGVTYKEAENILLNEDKMQTSASIEKEDKELLNAIYASFMKQFTTEFYSSSSDFILFLRNKLGREDVAYKGKAGFLNILEQRLLDHDAPVIISDFDGGLHAINAIRLVQDSNDANIYHIGVYDNNYPGEKRYVTMECNQTVCVTKANSYYSGSGQPIRMSASLEDDLSYYN